MKTTRKKPTAKPDAAGEADRVDDCGPFVRAV